MRIENKVDGAGMIIAVENLLPGFSAIVRTKDASLRIRAVGMTERGDEDNIGVLRIDADTGDGLRIGQSRFVPCFSRVCGFVHAVALHDVSAQLGFTHSDIHNVRVRFRDSHCADGRAGDLSISDRLPGCAAVDGFPKPAAHRAEVIFKRTVGTSSAGEGSSPSIRPDVPPLQSAKHRCVITCSESNVGCEKSDRAES